MTLSQCIAFLTFALVAAITPGPSNVMITATGTAAGFVRGLPCAFGAAAGMASLLFSAALGLGQIVLAQPLLLQAANFSGAAFLLWMAWKIATAGPPTETQAARPVGFMAAALFQWANPKGWLVAVSASSTFLQAGTGAHLSQAIVLGALFFAVALPSGIAWLALGSVLQSMLRNERKARLINIAMGAALAASVVFLFW